MRLRLIGLTNIAITLFLISSGNADAWWNKDWTIRKKITLDTTAKGVAISQPIAAMTVLLRLHDGNFQFSSAKDDGSDIRFVAADEKTLLSYHIERFDSLLGEAFVWVKVPNLQPSAPTTIWLYYGNTGPTAIRAESAKASFDSDTALVYHFSDKSGPPTDATANANNATGNAIPVSGSLIGGGLRLTSKGVITIPPSPTLAWTQGITHSWSAWLKPVSNQENAVVYSRVDGSNNFNIGVDKGAPFVEINGQRSSAAAPMAVNTWHNVAVISEANKVTVYLDGAPYNSIATALPNLNSPAGLGGALASGDQTTATGFIGEMDELEISNVARSPDFIKVLEANQGGDKDSKFVSYGQDEQRTSWFSGGGTLTVLVNSLTVDGWVVIIILACMACLSWWVMVTKIRYLNAIAKGNAFFMREWKHVAEDLTALDDDDAESARSLGGRVNKEGQRAMRNASVYRIYHLGVEEIRHRIAADNAAEGTRRGLAGRSIQAIRATLDGGLVRETQKINRLIVLLTICISGGPFLGLLGTVIGVMITFAAIAAAGDVNVNAIAPGIAAALLATVAGLAVAIPALFGYNYIISRVKDAKDDMAIFIDEFVTKMAEFYRETPPGYKGHRELFQEDGRQVH